MKGLETLPNPHEPHATIEWKSELRTEQLEFMTKFLEMEKKVQAVLNKI